MDLELCRTHPLLSAIPLADLEELLELCHILSLPAGETLLTPGQENHTLYFLLQGTLHVQINPKDANNDIVLQPGEIVGEMSIIEQQPVGARVVAGEDSTVLVMPETAYWESYCTRPALIRPLLRSLIARMRRTNRTLQEVLERQLRFEMLQRDIESAARIQANLLPSHLQLIENRYLDISAHFKPARGVGGDFYDVLPLSGNRVAFAIGDVSGKGMPAALFMVRASTLLRTLLAREDDPAALLPELNRQLCAANDEFMFVTLALLIIKTDTGRVTYLNGGHNPVLFAERGGPFEVWNPPQGAMLGVNALAVFSMSERQLNDGESLVLYTDGVTEAENAALAQFGLARTLESLSHPGDGSCTAGMIEQLEVDLSKHVGDCAQSDDITVLAVTYRRPSPATALPFVT